MKRPDSFPAWAWNMSVVALAGAVLVSITLLAATLMGIGDAPHLGKLVIDQSFVEDLRSQIAAPANDAKQIETLSAGITCPCTIELQMRQLSGPPDAGYGLWWGQPDQPPMTLVGANSDGYLTILPTDPAVAALKRDWQLFPHVHPLSESNTFRLDIDTGRLTIRLNDEVTASMDTDSPAQISAGYFVQASQTGDTVFQLGYFKVWETEPSGD